MAGRVWVLTTRREGTAGVIEVFSPDREFLTSILVPGRPHAVAFSEDRFFALTRDSNGFDVIIEYRLGAERNRA